MREVSGGAGRVEEVKEEVREEEGSEWRCRKR